MAVRETVPCTPFKDCDSCGQWVVELHSADSISGEGSFCGDCLGCDPDNDFATLDEAKAEAVRLTADYEVPHIVIRDWDFTERPSFYVMIDPEPWPCPGRYEEVARVDFTPPAGPLEHDDPDRARDERRERLELADYFESTIP